MTGTSVCFARFSELLLAAQTAAVCSGMNASAKKIGMREKVFPNGTYVEREATSELIPQAVVTANLNAVGLEARQ